MACRDIVNGQECYDEVNSFDRQEIACGFAVPSSSRYPRAVTIAVNADLNILYTERSQTGPFYRTELLQISSAVHISLCILV